MHLSFKNRPDFEPLEGRFKDLISPLDSIWMLGKMSAIPCRSQRIAFCISMLSRQADSSLSTRANALLRMGFGGGRALDLRGRS